MSGGARDDPEGLVTATPVMAARDVRSGEPPSPFLGDNKSDHSMHSGTPVMVGGGIRIAKDTTEMKALGHGAIQVRMAVPQKLKGNSKPDFEAAGGKTKFFIPPFKAQLPDHDAGSEIPQQNWSEGAYG